MSQGVLLHLLRHLTYGININMPHTFGWMISVVNAIIPTNPMIAMHVQPIFNEVYAVLNYRQYLPMITGDDRAFKYPLSNTCHYVQEHVKFNIVYAFDVAIFFEELSCN